MSVLDYGVKYIYKKKIKFVKFEIKAYWQGGSHMSIEIEMMQINSFIYLP